MCQVTNALLTTHMMNAILLYECNSMQSDVHSYTPEYSFLCDVNFLYV